MMILGKKVSPLAIAVFTALSVVSCASNSSTETATGENTAVVEEQDNLEVVTTFLPMTQFTKAVVGDRAEVTQLLPANVGPHDYQAKPADVQAIAQADILIKNGLELEFYLDDMINNAENSDLIIVDSSSGIEPLRLAEKDHEHDHDHDHDHNHDHEHDHNPAHDHGEFDPHIWLDPKRAIQQVENIRDGLIAADPEGQEIYTQNAAAFIEQLKALDAQITEKLQPYAGQTFITFHDFASYFAQSYGLRAEFLVDIPAENPSPEDVRRLIEIVQAEQIKALLQEPGIGTKAFETLAQDLKIKVSIFDPIAIGETTSTQPTVYLRRMEENATNLVEALSD
ncbi:zinc ABC transporter substrate-binding protein [Roseofilum sp. BLCC_M91]|uniref:Zinc ABC transporter substrate-binding protein n=1 Tax=Roseofilum halophilum BLCC-M91 TaxID=3022259 RepID=A0ABT7BI66_9CYAN|nr:zinc ABC transporter substrate-binding protein [Roseofilum halophilum]MDJ1178775.1 zinc ABC transporter substrate-binding protein [Roseofilum halophilum BLCC-M91]